MRTCTRCILDTTVPGIRFDEAGVCHLCHVHTRLETAFAEQASGFRRLVDRIRAEGRGRPYDCIVPVSGGSDSSFALVHVVRDLGLRPLACNLDNGWVSDIGRRNLATLVERLGVPLKTFRFPWPDLSAAYVACLRASIPEVCLPCLVAVFSLAYRASAEEGVRTVIFSSSPLTEGIAPARWSYVDGRYLRSVVARHGTPGARRVVREFDRISATSLLVGALVRRTRVVMLPLYVPWDERANRDLLRSEYGWIDGGKHSDCLYTPFRDWFIARKFGFDIRRLGRAALVRNGRLGREEALRYFEENPPAQPDDARMRLVLDRLGLGERDLEALLDLPLQGPDDYATWRPALGVLRPFVREACRRGILSAHVYDKFYNC
ncbi:MAG: hypothetical protein JXB39_08850 [Deltaproteobacteria bacterium]|nr:hypothetical protein [Deltaproteobacteria bacterium]